MADPPVIPRREWVQEFGEEYQAGQDVTIIGPSGRGKTKLVGQMLIVCAGPHLQAILLHGKVKGRDDTIKQMSKAADMRITPKWPPSWRPHDRNSRGWILLPLTKPGGSPQEENDRLRTEYKKAIQENYHAKRKHPRITVVNEALQTHVDLKLKLDCEQILARGRPDSGIWHEIQRGRHVSYLCYDQPEWIIVFKDPNEDNRKRYAEIGDIDPRYMEYLCEGLQTRTVADGSTISEAVAFRRSGQQVEIIGF